MPTNKHSMDLLRRVVAEALGTAFLLAAVVGSGIMAERLAGGNSDMALLANTLATGAALVALILTFGQISGAHFNPAVTLADAWQGGISWPYVPAYIGAQIIGAFAGVAAANVMFGLPSSNLVIPLKIDIVFLQRNYLDSGVTHFMQKAIDH
jgi:glycerol uptake facilitator-like aquaporin